MLLRGYKREASAILQKDPDILRSIVQVPASSIANIIARAKVNVARQLAALATFQTSPESLKYSSSETYFENNQGFRQAELLVQPIKAAEYSSNVTSFLSRNVNSPYIQQHRGFKTLRSSSEKEEDLTSSEDLFKIILKSNPTKEKMQQITNILKDVELSQDEKKQVLFFVICHKIWKFTVWKLRQKPFHSVEITEIYHHLCTSKYFVKSIFSIIL